MTAQPPVVMGQQYSSATFLSLRLHYRNENFGSRLKNITIPVLNTLRTGHLNCLNPRSWALNTVIQLLYFVSLKIHNKFAYD
jgi:hypothetical protein